MLNDLQTRVAGAKKNWPAGAKRKPCRLCLANPAWDSFWLRTSLIKSNCSWLRRSFELKCLHEFHTGTGNCLICTLVCKNCCRFGLKFCAQETKPYPLHQWEKSNRMTFNICMSLARLEVVWSADSSGRLVWTGVCKKTCLDWCLQKPCNASRLKAAPTPSSLIVDCLM